MHVAVLCATLTSAMCYCPAVEALQLAYQGLNIVVRLVILFSWNEFSPGESGCMFCGSASMPSDQGDLGTVGKLVQAAQVGSSPCTMRGVYCAVCGKPVFALRIEFRIEF